MANLKDLLVKGPSRFIGDIIANKARLTSLEIPTTSSGSTYGLGSSGQILKTNGSSVYWADDVVSKLGTATIGSSSQPIYLNNGTPTAITGAIANDTTGNAATATVASKLSNTSAIGSSTQPVYFNSSGQPVAVNKYDRQTGKTTDFVPRVGPDGVMEIGKYIDFHNTSEDTSDYIVRITARDSSETDGAGLTLTGTTVGTFKGNLNGTATKATQDGNGNVITSTYKTKQNAVADVAVTNATATEFISSVTQDTNGVISVEKKKLPNVVTYTQNNNVSVPGVSADATTTKTVYKYNQTTIFTPNGLIMGGTALEAGLATRGICGILISNNSTGAATKDNLYINYDGDTTYRVNRQLILQAGTQGTNYGNNVYQYAAVRGDAMKAWVEAKGYSTTDEKVKQNIETSNANYPILFSYSTSPTSGTNEYVKYTDKITINPYDGCISPNTSGLYDLGTNSYQWKNIYGEYFSGNATTATTLATGRTLKVNLASTSASTAFNGAANITDIGVSGILPIAQGGTNSSTALTANRLMCSNSNGGAIVCSSDIYSDGSKLGVNKTSITSGYNFEVQGKSKFNGDIDLSITSGSEGRITRGEKISNWYNGRDKAMLFLTSNQYYNVFASIKAGNSSEAITDRGSWDIGVTGYTASEHKIKLLFSYITDDNYTNGTSSTLPTAQIRFTPDGAIEADNFIGNMKRPGKVSAWWEGRDKAIISMTSNSNSGYNPFISIKADGNGTDSTLMGSWDIGVNKYRSDRQNQLIFSYITDTVYTNHTNTLPSGQIRFCPDGSILGATWTGNTVGVAYGGTGKSTFIPNRLLYTSGSTSLAECTMYASSTQLAINTTSMIDEADTFEVNGMSYLAGEVITDGTISPVENGIYDLGTEDYRWNKIYVNKFDPDVFLQNINVTLSSTWQNIQNNGADIELPYDGTYIIQIYDNTTSVGHYQTYWSGIFSWYTGNISGITNSNGYEYSEIPLHGSGQAINAKNIYLRTYSQNSSKMRLQIKGNNNLTSSTSNVISIKIKYIM